MKSITRSEPVLPDNHRAVLDECIAEAWRNHENSDVHTKADIAADIVERLARVYGVVATYEPEVAPHIGTLLSGEVTCTCGWTSGHYALAWDALDAHARHAENEEEKS